MSDISKIKLPSGNEYNFADAAAREAIAALEGGSYFLGVTTSNIVDGQDCSPVVIKTGESTTKSVTPTHGNMVVKDSKEFIYYKPEGAAAGKWLLYGDDSDLGQLAYKDSVTLVKDVNNVVGYGATVSVGNPSVSLAKTDGSAGTGQVLLVDDVEVMGVTQPTISDGSTVKANVLSWSGADGPTKATVVKTVSATPTYFKTQTITGIGESTVASRINNATQQKLIKDSFSFGVTNETLIITAPDNNNTVTFATGGAGTTGTGANVVLGSQVTAVENIPMAGTGVEVITATTQAGSTGAVGIVQAISSTNETNAVTVGGNLASYAIKNQVASGGSVSLDVTKKVVSGSATQGTVTFNKDQKTVLSNDTNISVS